MRSQPQYPSQSGGHGIFPMPVQHSFLYCNESSKRMAAIWNLGPRCARSVSSQDYLKIPDEVFEVCRSLKTHWTPCRLPGEETPPGPETTVICRRVPDLRVKVWLVDPPAHSLSMPSFMVVFEDRQQVSCVDTSAELSGDSLRSRLSNCEQEVAQLVCAGKSNKEIAEALGKSVLTVKKQVHAIYQKLGVSSRARLVNLSPRSFD